MKAVILAGGMGKRLGELTRNTPKPLLPIAGYPIINYVVKKIEELGTKDTIYISTISIFADKFYDWKQNIKCDNEIKIIVPNNNESQSLGSIGAIRSFINNEDVNDDVMVIAGDNLFSFSLKDFLAFYRAKLGPVVACIDLQEKDKVKGKYGVLDLNNRDQIIEFQEKPSDPKTSLASTGCYLFPQGSLALISEYLDEKNNPDAPGYFISWLYKRVRTYGFKFSGWWFDIGSPEDYQLANENMTQLKIKPKDK